MRRIVVDFELKKKGETPEKEELTAFLARDPILTLQIRGDGPLPQIADRVTLKAD